jgi:hypothetical protein
MPPRRRQQVMKPLVVISLVVASFFILMTGLLLVAGVHIHLNNPLAAALISIGAGLAGIAPIAASRRDDPVGVFQLALVGTVLHMVAAIAFSGAALAIHAVAIELNFTYWLLAGYFVSLVALVWQLRRVLFTTFGIAKAQ